MRNRSLIVLVVGCLSLGAPAESPAAASVATLRPVEDVSLPFWCDWGYDWDERCYHDDTARLSIGGDADKVWRSALRFSLDELPLAAGVQEARLGLWHDGTCVGRHGGSRRCDGRAWTVDSHAILDPDWLHEREVAFDPSLVARGVLPPNSGPGWLVLDVTELVAAWASGEAPNAGILLKLADAQEDFLGSGPKLPSSSFGTVSRRPWLEVAYVAPDGWEAGRGREFPNTTWDASSTTYTSGCRIWRPAGASTARCSTRSGAAWRARARATSGRTSSS